MLKIGLTGSIGSGKTTVATIFRSMGIPVFHADDVAKELYQQPSIKLKVIQALGKISYLKNGTLNKKFIAEQVFNNPTILESLNNILHPAVLLAFEKWSAQFSKQTYIIHEAAILFETGYFKKMDSVILVTAPDEIRIGRVMKRDGATQQAVKNRINNQWADSAKIPLANYRVINDDRNAIIPQVIAIHQDLLIKCTEK